MTLFLNGDEIVKLLTIDDCIEAVERAFREGGEATSIGIGHFHVKAAIAGNRFAAKVNGNFPGNPERHGLPTIQGLIILADAERGTPLAVLDSIEITALRTAAASAVAAKYLALPDVKTITIVGCGAQARAHLEAMRRVRPIERVFAVDVDPAKAAAIGEVRSLDDAVRESDIVVTCTTSTTPFLRREHLHPGLFIAAVGADNPRKSELEPELLANAKVVADVLEQAATMGDLHHAIEAGLMSRDDVFGELADVIRGRGRTSGDEVFVFDSTGTALLDVAVAAMAYERASSSSRVLERRTQRD
jgi:ornithine cyclodeaminase/alanine dehydrogenase-like protein (mu-crystallin family)